MLKREPSSEVRLHTSIFDSVPGTTRIPKGDHSATYSSGAKPDTSKESNKTDNGSLTSSNQKAPDDEDPVPASQSEVAAPDSPSSFRSDSFYMPPSPKATNPAHPLLTTPAAAASSTRPSEDQAILVPSRPSQIRSYLPVVPLLDVTVPPAPLAVKSETTTTTLPRATAPSVPETLQERFNLISSLYTGLHALFSSTQRDAIAKDVRISDLERQLTDAQAEMKVLAERAAEEVREARHEVEAAATERLEHARQEGKDAVLEMRQRMEDAVEQAKKEAGEAKQELEKALKNAQAEVVRVKKESKLGLVQVQSEMAKVTRRDQNILARVQTELSMVKREMQSVREGSHDRIRELEETRTHLERENNDLKNRLASFTAKAAGSNRQQLVRHQHPHGHPQQRPPASNPGPAPRGASSSNHRSLSGSRPHPPLPPRPPGGTWHLVSQTVYVSDSAHAVHPGQPFPPHTGGRLQEVEAENQLVRVDSGEMDQPKVKRMKRRHPDHEPEGAQAGKGKGPGT